MPAGRSSDGAALLLGGRLSPIGNGVCFVQAPFARVVDAVRQIHRQVELSVAEVAGLEEGALALDPMEAPWTVELLVDCGAWTCYLNNRIGGGDITAVAPAVAHGLGVECVTAQHAPMHGPRHAATQLWLQGPLGEPPLMYVRTLSAHCQDGRWRWRTSGEVQWFEDADRYRARNIRDRLDRSLLVDYLHMLGIRADDPSFFGRGVVVRQTVDWPVRRDSVIEWRRANLPPGEIPGRAAS